jgi:hypothetical protein
MNFPTLFSTLYCQKGLPGRLRPIHVSIHFPCCIRHIQYIVFPPSVDKYSRVRIYNVKACKCQENTYVSSGAGTSSDFTAETCGGPQHPPSQY